MEILMEDNLCHCKMATPMPTIQPNTAIKFKLTFKSATSPYYCEHIDYFTKFMAIVIFHFPPNS